MFRSIAIGVAIGWATALVSVVYDVWTDSTIPPAKRKPKYLFGIHWGVGYWALILLLFTALWVGDIVSARTVAIVLTAMITHFIVAYCLQLFKPWMLAQLYESIKINLETQFPEAAG